MFTAIILPLKSVDRIFKMNNLKLAQRSVSWWWMIFFAYFWATASIVLGHVSKMNPRGMFLPHNIVPFFFFLSQKQNFFFFNNNSQFHDVLWLISAMSLTTAWLQWSLDRWQNVALTSQQVQLKKTYRAGFHCVIGCHFFASLHPGV